MKLSLLIFIVWTVSIAFAVDSEFYHTPNMLKITFSL